MGLVVSFANCLLQGIVAANVNVARAKLSVIVSGFMPFDRNQNTSATIADEVWWDAIKNDPNIRISSVVMPVFWGEPMLTINSWYNVDDRFIEQPTDMWLAFGEDKALPHNTFQIETSAQNRRANLPDARGTIPGRGTSLYTVPDSNNPALPNPKALPQLRMQVPLAAIRANMPNSVQITTSATPALYVCEEMLYSPLPLT